MVLPSGENRGDPAISVVSAVEGLDVVTPSLSHLVVPIALVIWAAKRTARVSDSAHNDRALTPVQ